MWRLVKFLFGQMPGVFLATVVALMFGAPPEDLLVKWMQPLWDSPPDWLLSWQFRWFLLVLVLLIFFRRVLQAMDRRLVSLAVIRNPILNTHNPDLDAAHKWLFGLTIKNDGTEDIEAKCLVKVLDAWNEHAMRVARLPFNLRPKGQVDEDRNEPFNLRIGEPKTVAIAYTPSIAGDPLHVEFVDGWDFLPVPMDAQMSRWIVLRIAAFGGGLPAYSTGVLELKGEAITFRRRRIYECITKSYPSAKAAFYLRRIWRGVRESFANLKGWIMPKVTDTKQRFDRLLHSMLTKPPLEEKPKAKRRASSAEKPADCDETQTPQDSSEDAS